MSALFIRAEHPQIFSRRPRLGVAYTLRIFEERMKSATDALIEAVRSCVDRSPYVLTPFGENGPDGRGVMCDQACWHTTRRAVRDYAACLRALGVAPERGLAVMKDALRTAIPGLDPTSVLLVSAGPWLLDGYYSADTSVGT